MPNSLPEIWTESEILLGDLKDYDKNPRRISKTKFEALVNKIKRDGYHDRIKVNLDNRMVGGHQRKKALLALGFKLTDPIKVLIPPRLLSEEEFKRSNFEDNLPYGEYDVDMIANNYDIADLMEWQVPQGLLPELPEIEEEPIKPSKKNQKCPECGHEF